MTIKNKLTPEQWYKIIETIVLALLTCCAVALGMTSCKAWRTVNTTVATMVKQRKGDLTKIAADQAAFIAQKDLADGKKTLKAYYWKICGEAYDESLNG